MGRLRLAWTALLAGLASSVAGTYLLAGLAWSFVVLGAELVSLGILIANLGDDE